MPESAGGELAGEAALQRIADVARELAALEDLDETLQRIVDLSVDHIEQCDGATLMFVRAGKVVTPAASDPRTRKADLAQYETGEGPCLTAMREHETVVIDDIAAEQRWPAWSEEIASLGWGSMVGLRLFIAAETMGALNLYSEQPGGFDGRSGTLAQVFASHAAVAMRAAITESGLQQALESRDVIGQAKGVLMERERISGQQAFDRLRQISNDRNVKLRELARDIVETGEVPG